MQLTFRPLRAEEVSEASYLVDAAYAPQVRTLYGDQSRLRQWHHYEESKILSFLKREPEGVRVGVWRDRILTFHVCRSYGSLGWFHTLAVHPEFQQRGLGRKAVRDAEQYLFDRGVSTIGLMTWPMAINNLAFYQRLHYQFGSLSLYAYRHCDTPIITGRSPFYASVFDLAASEEQERQLEAIRVLCQQISPGLDYRSWITWAHQTNFAETLLIWRRRQLFGLALSYFFPHAHWAEGKLLLLHPDLSDDGILWMLEHLRQWARARHRGAFGFPVDLSGDVVRKFLLPHGFRLFPESMANMFKGAPPPHADLHFVRFSG